jgi:hypothetical protein
VLREREITLLDRLMTGVEADAPRKKTLSTYVRTIARLGGHLARSRDPPPGALVLWRGLSRLADIELGAEIAEQPNCG